MRPRQLADGLKLLQITADGLLAALQKLAQRGNQDASVFGQLLLDHCLAVNFQHTGLSPCVSNIISIFKGHLIARTEINRLRISAQAL
ncbi:hypothetical protein SDC9_76292 [bioreactor metagenome]|uniref:Uncharacterized protein n=1 Tax=bioreactor metagenome TaxID=1076179 RepID=A0A644YPF7_9ZZZZ